MNLSDERKSFLAGQAERFDQAVDYLRHAINIDAGMKALARKFFEARSGTLYWLFGGPTSLYAREDPTVVPYDSVYETVHLIETLAFFLSHEVCDDGSPAIVYYRSDDRRLSFNKETKTFDEEMFPLGHTTKGAPLSFPYLHRSTDFLWEKGIPFETASVENLMALLDEMEEEAKRDDERVKTLRRFQNRPEDEPEVRPYQHLIPDFF